MKKIILLLVTASTSYLFAQNVTFTDPNLKQKIVLHGQNVVGGVTGTNISLIDTDLNGEISITEAQAYTGRLYLNQNGSNFYTDLTGVEEFINITELYCENNQMTNIDVSSHTALTGLYCENNQISNLDLSNNTNLSALNIRYNNLNSINLINNSNLVSINCENNSLSTLNLANQVNLNTLTCNDNNISSLNLSNQTNLTSLICNDNNISSIEFGTNSQLSTVVCHDNIISNLNLSNFTNLESVDASYNNLVSILFPTSTSCETINIRNNSLTNIDISGLSNFYVLNAQHNEITTLNLDSNSNLESILLNNNLIDSLNLSNLSLLSYLTCNDNDLFYLDISNGNNSNISEFNALNNQNLNCIEVDDITFSTNNWTNIDIQTSFSIDCPTLVNSITVQGENSMTEITTDGGTLQLMATVLPIDATDNTYTWSITNGTGAGTIDNNGLLTATNNGTVNIVATANDGSGITGNISINISNQTMLSIEENLNDFDLTVYPNPTNGVLNISSNNKIELIEIYNITGQKVFQTNQVKFDVNYLESGIYSIRIVTKKRTTTKQVIIK